MIVGQECLCWRCGTTFIINKVLADLKKPHCVKCTRRRGDEKIEDALKEIEQSPI